MGEVSMSTEQVIEEIQNTSINPLTIQHASRDTCPLVNKHASICWKLSSYELDNCI